MAKFEYSGRNQAGALVTGTLEAMTPEDVASILFGESVTPIDIKELRKAKKSPDSKTSPTLRGGTAEKVSLVDNINSWLAGRKVTIDELIIFSRQMYSLTKAGLPLDRAISGLAASISNPVFKRILLDVVASLEGGTALATSLGRHPKVFSNLVLSLVHVGENTGRLDAAFKEINKYLALEKQTRKQVKSATRYPIFVMSALAAALAVITVFVIPVFSSVFDRLGADLPWQTVALIRTSDFVINYWPLLIGSVAVSFLAFKSYVGTQPGRYNWDRRKLKIPLAGNVLERVALGRFARTFSMVMRAGVPVVQGLTVVAGAVGNEYVKRTIFRMRENVERGESLYRTAVNSDMFSPIVLQMIAVGEETGTVDELMEEVADFYDAEVEYDLKQLSDAIEPILIVMIAGLVLILALGVFLPIWDLNTQIR
ncbi:MAG: type II secretion system F family protein [Pseudohongiellaceae bacterium]